jgi:apolipoprotein N-acyltransferase
MSHFPVSCGWLAWIALVPLLSLVRTAAPKRWVYGSAWVSGLGFYTLAIQWMRVADYRMNATWIGLSLYCSFFPPVGICLIRYLDRRTRLPLIVTVPVVWTALEFFRAHFGTGFPWYFLSHTQHKLLPVIQVSDLAGAYAVTFMVAAVNALWFEILLLHPKLRHLLGILDSAARLNPRSLLVQTAAVLLLIGACLAYGAWQLSEAVFEPGPRIALIQGNLDQRVRLAASEAEEEAAITAVVEHYRSLSDRAAAQPAKPDLIVWPETSYPEDWVEVSPELPPEKIPAIWRQRELSSRRLARAAAQRWQTNALLGMTCAVLGPDERPRRYNSAVLIQAQGEEGGRYDKMHLVPFGEYVPFRDWLPWMNALAPYDFDYSVHPGEQRTRFPLGAYHFGVLICYEDTDPYIARQHARSEDGEPAADFLINISNDGWFNGTSEHEEHLAICRFRAVESRRAIARAVNMGISAVIDGNGRVIALPGPSWAQSKKIAAVVTETVPLDRRTSLYTRWGDWLPWACWLVIALGLLGGLVRPARSFGTLAV